MSKIIAGVDIGGTKCSVCLGQAAGDTVEVLDKVRFPTPPTPGEALQSILTGLDELLARHSSACLAAIGISCGGPLDSRAGLILSPPNLPGWDEIDVLSPLRQRFGVPAALQNDANAGALAEWKWGAGRSSAGYGGSEYGGAESGVKSMIFLTFGTGMGAGLILDGRLYSGANDLAGEAGHVRLEHDGPLGYGKPGSFEGFCSGGGIARLAASMAQDALEAGCAPAYCPTPFDLESITAESVGAAAQAGDQTARKVFDLVGRQLGRGLALLVDILNPELIVIGGIYGRQMNLLEAPTLQSLQAEALPRALSVCRILPAALGEAIGDLASLAVGMEVSG